MGYKIGVISQKGGVGKSTLCRGIAAAYAKAEWNVKIADLDINQSTSFAWQLRRLQAEISPAIAVEVFGQIKNALKAADACDLMIFDGTPMANAATVDIANAADLIVLPTGLSLDDLQPTVTLANTLADKHSIAPNKIAFALCRVGTSAKEMEEAREYLGQTPYYLLDGMMQEKTAFRRAQDIGLSVIESTYKKPREQADKLIQSIIDRLETLTK